MSQDTQKEAVPQRESYSLKSLYDKSPLGGSKPRKEPEDKTEEVYDEKRRVKERMERVKMKVIAQKLLANEPLEYKQKYQATFFLKKYFEPEDLSDYLSMKRKYTITTNCATVLSLVNIVVVGALWRRFLTLKPWQKFGVGVGVFVGSHSALTYFVKKESETKNDELITKYKDNITRMRFDEDQVY